MRFKKAVEKTKGLAGEYQPGIQALKSADQKRIRRKQKKPRKPTGSIDLDNALHDSHPDDSRWDYGIGLRETQQTDRVIWIEVHPASSSHIQDMLNKFDWLKNWLASSAPLLNKMSAEFVWIASGSVHLPPNSPQRKKLAAKGIHFAGSSLEV